MDKKIDELKLKNKQRLFLGNLVVSTDDYRFIDLNKTLSIQNDILSIIDNMDKNKTFEKCDSNDVIKIYKEKIYSTLVKEEKYYFWPNESDVLGAIEIPGMLMLENLDRLIDNSEYINYGCSLFIVSVDLKHGYCLWESEYDVRLYLW